MSLRYVIDGYNVTNHPLFNRKHKNSSDPQRQLSSFILTNRLTGSAKNKITLVFDGYPPACGHNLTVGNIDVIFSCHISADERIKRIVEESADRKNIVVVSDDKEIKFIIKAIGAQSLGVEGFIGAKEKNKPGPKKESAKQELNYSQIDAINKEFSKLWLKKK